jgi:hypothetical protein
MKSSAVLIFNEHDTHTFLIDIGAYNFILNIRTKNRNVKCFRGFFENKARRACPQLDWGSVLPARHPRPEDTKPPFYSYIVR